VRSAAASMTVEDSIRLTYASPIGLAFSDRAGDTGNSDKIAGSFNPARRHCLGDLSADAYGGQATPWVHPRLLACGLWCDDIIAV
jgi:hypothetical protein